MQICLFLMPVQYSDVIDCVSPVRLNTYKQAFLSQPSGAPLATAPAVKAYFLLNDISQHFFVPLQLVEVTLRNKLNAHIKRKKNNPRWYDVVPVGQSNLDKVHKAKTFASNSNIHYQPDDVVCRLMFGFWVSLLGTEYRNTRRPMQCIWDQFALRQVFPGAPSGLTLGLIFNRLTHLNDLRNRLFHHEPIWKSGNVSSLEDAIARLQHQYNEVIEALNWLSPEMKALTFAWSFPGRMAKACDVSRFDRELW